MPTVTPKGRTWLPYVLGCITVLVAGLLWQGLSNPPAAYGQIPDSGAQQAEMIKELRASNQKLTEIAGYLREIRDAQTAEKKDKSGKTGAAPTKP